MPRAAAAPDSAVSRTGGTPGPVPPAGEGTSATGPSPDGNPVGPDHPPGVPRPDHPPGAAAPDRGNPDEAPGGLLDLLRVAAFVLDERARIVLWSPEAERLFGYRAEEAVGANAGELLILPAHLERVTEWFLRVLGGEQWAGVFPIRCRDGSIRRAEFRHISMRAPDGRRQILGLAADAETVRELETTLALSDSLVEQSPIGLALFDEEMRWRRVNPALERINGIPAERLLGRRLDEMLPGIDPGRVASSVRRVLSDGRPVVDQTIVGRTPADPDRDHVWSVSYYRVMDRGNRPLGVAASAIDVTERHRAGDEVAEARERLAVIAEAGDRIGSSLDLPRIARELADVSVPRLADLATVDLLDDVLTGDLAEPVRADGSIRFRALAVAFADRGAGSAAAARATDRVGDLAEYGPTRVITRCVTLGRTIVLPRVGEKELRRIARDADAARLLAEAGAHSYLAVPLIARGHVLGALGLCRTDHPRPFGPADVSLAGELAARAAISVDNARLYHRERRTALTLQRSLLPPVPTDRPGLDLAARYLPAVSEAGGDWYDVLPQDDGRTGLIVGDVMGKGVHAAAIMGQLRSTTRALARLSLPPAELLEHLDATTTGLGESIATCVHVVCNPAGGWCEVTSAGHPPPVMVDPDGRAHLLEVPPARPLGVGGAVFSPRRVPMPPGATLILYTDGLVEDRRDDIDVGLRTLLNVVSGPSRSLEAMCDAVLEALHRDPRDDVALLLARNHP
ncbi:SpoIIE family protein phosphatase [Streptomyces calidiresistens]|uniref:protein-serine/threonine phosphatase n=1 Tax=Streptomyces calidiresistens TaxID=1485586 RepID=A0A7W3XVS1_9ACTN|nr:SpoIIE family protein phosphatase [Streptomyces calidiresistens]